MVSSTARVRLSGVRVPLTRYTHFDDGRRTQPISRGRLGGDRTSSSPVSGGAVARLKADSEAAEVGGHPRRRVNFEEPSRLIGEVGVDGAETPVPRRELHVPRVDPERADDRHAPRRCIERDKLAGEVGDLVRPIAFRSHGYRNLDVPLKGMSGDVVDVGTVTLEPLPEGQGASLKGRVVQDDPGPSASPTVTLSVSVGPINTPHNGYSPRRRWPEPIRVPVPETGEFSADGLSATEYALGVSASGHVRSSAVVDLAHGDTHDAGEIRLRSSNLGLYIGKPAPGAAPLAWEQNVPTALEKARAEGRPLLIMMTATWCGPCKALEEQTLDDPWIRQVLSRFVLVKAYEDREVERTYGCRGYPTLVFVRGDGRRAHTTSGNQPPLSFAGECLEAFERLALEPPPELRSLADAGVIPSR